MLQALKIEFNGHLEAADDPELSERLQYFVHVVVVALDGPVMWCHKPNPTKSGNSIQMSASQKCNKGKSPVLTARSALRDTFKELPPVLASALDDQLKLFPEGQARVSIPGDSPWPAPGTRDTSTLYGWSLFILPSRTNYRHSPNPWTTRINRAGFPCKQSSMSGTPR